MKGAGGLHDDAKHVVLLGDSIFDNERYVPAGLPVIKHLQRQIPKGWRATLLAVDGDVVPDVVGQLSNVPKDATHIVVSAGGNDALGCIPVLGDKVTTIESALMRLADIRDGFRHDYHSMLERVLALRLATAVCTIYDSVPGLPRAHQAALALFNEIILKEASEAGVSVVDLRVVCSEPTDYSEVSPIEPSGDGGRKVANAILTTLLRMTT
jgi:hypothetical protein